MTAQPRAPRLATLARMIEALPHALRCELSEGYCNTDRQPKGCRYITRTGKGRTGTRLTVRNRHGIIVLDHNSAETYRTNQEVLDWYTGLQRTGMIPNSLHSAWIDPNSITEGRK